MVKRPLLGLFAAMAMACGSGPWTELDSMEDLRSAFNEDWGRVRLVLLLSPT